MSELYKAPLESFSHLNIVSCTETLSKIVSNYKAMMNNLEHTQARCTELLEENRQLKIRLKNQ